jgi:hypothetical protein
MKLEITRDETKHFLIAVGIATLCTAAFGVYNFLLEYLGLLNLYIGSALWNLSATDAANALLAIYWLFFFVLTLAWMRWRR